MTTHRTKIPIRDLTSMFKNIPTMDRDQHPQQQSTHVHHIHRSRRDRSHVTTSGGDAVETSHHHQRSKSASHARSSDPRIKEMRNIINIKDNQLHELVNKITKLFEENERLGNEKMILMENYNSLYDKIDRDNILKMNNVDSGASDNQKHVVERLECENVNIRNDLKMLKILVFRLNKHIEYYQDLLNQSDVKFESPPRVKNENEIASSWVVNSHLLSPLIISYEERIREKNEIIQSYETELNQVSMKMKKILEENEKVHEAHENIQQNSEVWMTEKQRLTSQCEILSRKATIHAKRADLAKEKLIEVLKAYEQKVQSQNLDIERLQEAYNRSKGEITTLKNINKNPEAVTESIKECQKLFEDLKLQFEVEKRELIDDRHNMNVQINEMKNKLSGYESQVSELNGVIGKQKMCNESLNEKIKNLKKSLYTERQSKETLEKDLNGFREFGNEKFKESWQNISELHALIQEKEMIIQSLMFNHQKEVEDLKFKLHQRDQTLRRVLESKIDTNINFD